MKTILIVVYFGRPPVYFPLFLKSCSMNPDIVWLLVGDCFEEQELSENVRTQHMEFSEFQQLVRDRLDADYEVCSVSKICDYKPAFGYLFEDRIREFNWWGYCDLDQIFGQLKPWIEDPQLQTKQKLFCLGHLTLYKNTEENNRLFMNSLNGDCPYQRVFRKRKCTGFDEWSGESINEICLANEIPAEYSTPGADIDPYRTAFSILNFDVQTRTYSSSLENVIFHWKNGTLTGLYLENGKLQEQEFPYVHLQKRKMKVLPAAYSGCSFYIVPNRFVVEEAGMDPEKLITLSGRRGMLNTQYFKVKWKSLQQRIRTGNWNFRHIQVERRKKRREKE